MLITFFYYHLALLDYLFFKQNTNNPFHASVFTFFGHQTFRFPKQSMRDPLMLFRMYKIILSNLFSPFYDNGHFLIGDAAIFDSSSNTCNIRKNYVTQLTNTNTNGFIGRDKLLKRATILQSICIVMYLMLAFPYLFLTFLCVKNKLHIPIWLLNLFEALLLISILTKYKTRTLYFFDCYQNDANLLAFCLMKNKIYVNKIPSEVPLKFWNKIMVADELKFCFRYQEDEFKAFQETQFVKAYAHWLPEMSFNLLERGFKISSTPKNTIGFYSSGMWLRAKLGRIDFNDDAHKNENYLLNNLAEFTRSHTGIKLILFLHPIEKVDLQQTIAHYNALSIHYELAETGIANDMQFHKADVAVMLYSTISYERIFWGYKTLIYPIGHNDFFAVESNFTNVLLRSEESLVQRLKHALEQTSEDFLIANHISNYTYTNYLNFFKKYDLR